MLDAPLNIQDRTDRGRILGAIRNAIAHPRQYMGSHQVGLEAVRFAMRELEQEIVGAPLPAPGVNIKCVPVGEDDVKYEIERSRPFSEPMLISLAAWTCGAIGLGYARGDGIRRMGTPRVVSVLRTLEAIDERLKADFLERCPPRPRLYTLAPQFPPGAPPDHGVQIKLPFGVGGELTLMRTGDQYYLWSSDSPEKFMVLSEEGALRLAMALIKISDRVADDRAADEADKWRPAKAPTPPSPQSSPPLRQPMIGNA